MSEASVREFVLTATATEITNRIEQQAKELVKAQRKWIAEIERRQALERELEAAQARVVVLSEALKVCVLDLQKWAKHSPDCAPTVRMVEQALASTDTAAQTLRQQADQQAQPQAEGMVLVPVEQHERDQRVIQEKDAEIAGLRGELQSIWDNMPMEWKLHSNPSRAIISDAAIDKAKQ